MNSKTRALRADWVMVDSGSWVESGVLAIEDARVAGVFSGGAATRWCRARGIEPTDLGPGVLAPGLVNAHAHLELSGLAGRLQEAKGGELGQFTEWIRALMRARAESQQAEPQEAIRLGAMRCLSTGTTSVGDIDSGGQVRHALAVAGPRVRIFREVLDIGHPERRVSTLAAVEVPFPDNARIVEGVSPHAPYTVSDELFAAVAELVRKRAIPVCMHWAESEDEVLLMASGSGPMADLLPSGPRGAGLGRLEAAGLLGPSTVLVHANWSDEGERARIAAAGASVVHCPGSHAFFGRGSFDVSAWLDAGVPVALGTDSLASNRDLDMRREMRMLREAAPGLAPSAVWDAATRAGARSLDLEVGTLHPGRWADAVLFEASGARPAELLDALTCQRPRVRGVWLGGRRQKIDSNPENHE